MERLELADFLHYQFLSQVTYSPSGRRAALVVSRCNEEENRYESRLWLYEQGHLRQLTDLGEERSFVWEDEEHLLFPAVRSASEKKRREEKEQFTSYYRLDLRGGEATHAFTLPFAAREIRRLSDSLWLAVGTVELGCPDYAALSDEARKDWARRKADEADYEVLTEVPFWANGGGVTEGSRTGLFLCDVERGTAQRLGAPEMDVIDFAISEHEIYFTSVTWSGLQPHDRFSLFRADLPSGALTEIADYHLHGGGLHLVNDRLLLQATEGKRHGNNENRWVYTVDPASGALSVLRTEEYNMYSSVGSDCRYGGGRAAQAKGDVLYHLTTREGDSLLYALNRDGDSTPVVTKPGSIDAFSVSEHHNTALLIALYDNCLQELYEADLTTGQVSRISHFNDAVLAGKYIADPVALNTVSRGLNIGGWVLLPRDFDPAQRYPAVLDIHGGPKTAYGTAFFHEMQVWANLGYFVFFCNPMGSDGRDNVFMDIRGHYGETDYQNLMDFTDAVLERYPQIDPDRLCVTGGSYGGFMTNWIIGHTDRFCCAVSQRSIANWISFYGVSDIGPTFGFDQCDADPFDSPERMWDHSPMKFAANVRTPTLFLHSDEDYRCPVAEGYQMYTSLMVHGVPTRLVVFHGENHELSRSGKPLHRVRRLREITDWFEKYAKNRCAISGNML